MRNCKSLQIKRFTESNTKLAEKILITEVANGQRLPEIMHFGTVLSDLDPVLLI